MSLRSMRSNIYSVITYLRVEFCAITIFNQLEVDLFLTIFIDNFCNLILYIIFSFINIHI